VGLKSRLAHLAQSSDVPVFVVAGGGHRSALHRLRTTNGICFVASPRHASVLLVVGNLTEAAKRSVTQVHDQMAGPRLTIGWAHPTPTAVPLAANIDGDSADAAATLKQMFRELMTGAISPEAPLLPNVDAVEWRGVGPYGHGGAGMTGGTPYGRPLALRAPDPDGLELDQLPVTIGPWFSGFPAGLALRVSLQGDVAQKVEVVADDFVSPGPDGIFTRSMHEPTSIRELEMARAEHHLRWMADALMIAGVDKLAIRADRLAAGIGPGDVQAVESLTSAARRSLVRIMNLGGVGVLPADIDLTGLGPVARAAGMDEDRRMAELAYCDLEFEPVVQHAGDAWTRFVQRAAEAGQAVDLAGRAGDRVAFGDGETEAPDGLLRIGEPGPAHTLLSMLETVLAGREWGDLVAIVQSLDIDMESVSAMDRAS